MFSRIADSARVAHQVRAIIAQCVISVLHHGAEEVDESHEGCESCHCCGFRMCPDVILAITCNVHCIDTTHYNEVYAHKLWWSKARQSKSRSLLQIARPKSTVRSRSSRWSSHGLQRARASHVVIIEAYFIVNMWRSLTPSQCTLKSRIYIEYCTTNTIW